MASKEKNDHHLADSFSTQWHDGVMTSRFLTLAEVAETLNITISATRSLVSSGELPAIQLGGKRMWRVEETVLEKLIQQQYAASRERTARGA